MTLTDLFSGILAFVLLFLLGSILLTLTLNHRATLQYQRFLFICAFTMRFMLASTLYGSSLHDIVVGDGDDSGWAVGLNVANGWDQERVGLLALPEALARAFEGHHRGYYFVLALFFYFTRLASQLSAATLSGFAGSLAVVFAYRTARLLTSERAATWVGWWMCLFPVMVVWSSQSIKEPLVILLEIFAIYSCIQLRVSQFTLRHILLAGVSVFLLASMRSYAAYITALVVVGTLALPHLGRGKMPIAGALGIALIGIPLLSSSGAIDKDIEFASEWDIARIEQFRTGMATTARSGVESNLDLRTSSGLGLSTLVGATYLLLSPFPWQIRLGSLRMLLTAPEMLVWWYFCISYLPRGLTHGIRHKFGDVLPLLLFLLLLGGVYSLTFGNVGTAYRQRAQMMPYLLIFAAMGLERKKMKGKSIDFHGNDLSVPLPYHLPTPPLSQVNPLGIDRQRIRCSPSSRLADSVPGSVIHQDFAGHFRRLPWRPANHHES